MHAYMKLRSVSGKISISVLFASLVVSFFLLGKSLTSVSATTPITGKQWVVTSETDCISNGECGTRTGTKSVTYTCQASEIGTDTCSLGTWVVDTTYECPVVDWHYGSHHVSVPYEKSEDPTKCHRPSDDTLRDTYGMGNTERGWFKYWNPQSKDAIVTVGGHYEGSPDTNTETGVACTLEEPDYSSCPVGTCPGPETCGYDGGTVPDGKGGTTTCDPTDPCEDTRTHVCPDSTATNYDESIDSETEVADRAVCTYETSTPTPVPTPEPTPLVCGGDTHPDAAGKNCVSYQLGGAPAPSSSTTTTTAVLGASTNQQVLGTSTMAKTGSFEENLYLAIIALGGILTFKGIKNFKKASKKA